MAIIYRLDFVEGGWSETPNLQELKDAKVNNPGTITAYDDRYRVNNDPVDQEFEDLSTAEVRMEDLKGLYFIDTQRTLIAPQPEGLND